MSRNTTGNSWSHFGRRERDGVIEALPFCARRPRDGNEDSYGYDWHTSDLESGKISETLSTIPLNAHAFTAVHFYVLGGVSRENKFHDDIFYFDSEQPERGWRTAPPMLLPRMLPSAFATRGKIYVFGGSVSWTPLFEVFDINQNSWDLLHSPPIVDANSDCRPVLLDSSRSRILVHFKFKSNNDSDDFFNSDDSNDSNCSLYAYYIDGKSWECLDQDFGHWPTQSVMVDNVLYCLMDSTRRFTFCFSDWICCLKAYDLVEHKWLAVKWLSEFGVEISCVCHLLHLGNDQLCIVSYLSFHRDFNFKYIKIRVCNNSGETNATGESEYVTTVPFQNHYRDISLL